MKIVIAIYILMSVFHYLYQSIIAPSLRDHIGNQMLTLLDRFKHLKGTLTNKTDPAIEVVEESINLAIENIENFRPFALFKATELIKADTRMTAMVDERNRIIEQTDIVELRDIQEILSKYCFNALLVNSGGLLVWIAPIALVSYAFSGLMELTWSYSRSLITSVLFVPERIMRVRGTGDFSFNH